MSLNFNSIQQNQSGTNYGKAQVGFGSTITFTKEAKKLINSAKDATKIQDIIALAVKDGKNYDIVMGCAKYSGSMGPMGSVGDFRDFGVGKIYHNSKLIGKAYTGMLSQAFSSLPGQVKSLYKDAFKVINTHSAIQKLG